MIGNLIFATLYAVIQRFLSLSWVCIRALSLRRLVVPGVFQIEIGDNELDKIIFSFAFCVLVMLLLTSIQAVWNTLNLVKT